MAIPVLLNVLSLLFAGLGVMVGVNELRIVANEIRILRLLIQRQTERDAVVRDLISGAVEAEIKDRASRVRPGESGTAADAVFSRLDERLRKRN